MVCHVSIATIRSRSCLIIHVMLICCSIIYGWSIKTGMLWAGPLLTYISNAELKVVPLPLAIIWVTLQIITVIGRVSLKVIVWLWDKPAFVSKNRADGFGCLSKYNVKPEIIYCSIEKPALRSGAELVLYVIAPIIFSFAAITLNLSWFVLLRTVGWRLSHHNIYPHTSIRLLQQHGTMFLQSSCVCVV